MGAIPASPTEQKAAREAHRKLKEAIKKKHMDYWEEHTRGKPLSVYLRDWAESPKWVVAKAKAMEEEIAALKQERDVVISGARKFVEALREELGYDDDYYDRRDW